MTDQNIDRETRKSQLQNMSLDQLSQLSVSIIATTGRGFPIGSFVRKDLVEAILRHEFPDSETGTQ